MELSSVFVLALVSFVTGTPHGYGVKGGAVAKAEANAAAGAFGVLPAIPLSIPSGGGFSGSFSKSSSSSFASSSASASSSSSSYTFSGSGANGIAGFGCQSSGCKNGGNNIPSGLHGSFGNGVQSNGGALIGTGSTAASNAYSGNVGNSPCTGSNCNGFSSNTNECATGKCDFTGNQQGAAYGLPSYNIANGCASGKCNPESQNGNSQNGYESPKCVSGNCPPTSQQPTDTTYEPSGDKTDFNSNNNKGESQLECSHGKCEPHPSLSVTSSPDEHDIFIPLSPSANGAKPVYPKPTTQLVAPNLGPACTSHNCNIAPSGPDSGNGKLPTSYNVPILGPKPSTTNSLPDSNSNPTGTLYNLPTGTSSLNNCGSAGCSSDISLPTNTASAVTKPPVYSHGNYPSQLLIAPDVSTSCSGSNCKPQDTPNSQIPSQVPSKQSTTCNTPDCSDYPASGSSDSYPSQYDSPKPYTGAPSQSKPFGISTPNSNSAANVPQNNLINNGGYTSNTGSYNIGSHQGSFETKSKPSDGPASQNLPTYTGGFTKPTSSIGGNNGYSPSHGPSETSKPHIGVSSTTQHTPVYTGGFGGPTAPIYTSSGIDTQFPSKPSQGLAPPNGGYTTNTGSYNTGPQQGPSGTKFDEKYKPSVVPTNDNLPTYTGGFTKPTGSVDGNNGYTQFHGQTGTSKPHLGVSSTTQHTPVYTGGFGGPAGSIDKSPEINTQFTSKPSHGQTPVNGGYTSNTGSYNIGSQQGTFDTKFDEKYKPSIVPTSQNLPTYTGGFTKPTGSIDGNNGYTPLHVPTGSSKPHFGVSPTTQNTPIYSGGFGGSAGSIDTNSGVETQFASKPSLSHGEASVNNNNLPSTTTAGGVTSSIGDNSVSDSYSGLHGISKPSNSLVPPAHNIPAYSGHFGVPHGPTTVLQTGLASSQKPIDEKKKPTVYKGGFGGPTGLLKPNEFNLPAKSPATTSNSYTPNSCTSGSCDVKDVPNVIGSHQGSNGVSTTLSASAGAKAVAYTGGFGGPSGFLKPLSSDRHSKSESYGTGPKDQSGIHDYTTGGIDSLNKASGSPLDQTNSNDDSESNAGVLPNAGAQSIAGTQSHAGSQANAGAQANGGAQVKAGAQANAVAFASSSSFGANQDTGATGCNSGCGGNYGSGSGHNFASSNSQGVSHTGGLDNIHGLAGASASAKSVAGASAGVFGAGKSFASSSATAHSSAGASVKGGYGR